MINLGPFVLRLDHWLWLGLTFFLLGLGLLIWSYTLNRYKGPGLLMASLLKAIAIFLLALVITEPLLVTRQAKPGENTIAVLVDNSLSMSIKDQATGLTRGQLTLQALSGDWLTRLSKTFKVRQYLFDTRCRPMSDISELSFDVPQSCIYRAVSAIAEQFAARPLAAIILFTDGLATDTGQLINSKVPVYPVLAFDHSRQRDISISIQSIDQTAFDDGPVSVMALVHASGVAGRQLVVSIFDQKGTLLESQQWLVRDNDQTRSFVFKFRPTEPGVSFYRIQVYGSDQSLQEATLSNNQVYAAVERRSSPYKVLYVSGRPNWEYKFLQRAVAQDQEITLAALIRLAKQEPRYDFRGRPGQWSNPLYRGLEPNQPLEPYDRPVLIRLNISDPNELAEGMPQSPGTLFGYHGLIIDDLEAGFFSTSQMELIRQFVSVRGGGLLMLGGKDSLANGGYTGTALEQVLPVQLRLISDDQANGPFRLELTREGLLQPWLRLRTTESQEQQLLASMPQFHVLNPLGLIRPGGIVLANAIDADGHRWPAIVTGRFGSGRSAVLAIGDIWRWGMQDPASRSDMEVFWRRLVRWIVADCHDQVTITWLPDTSSASIKLQVRVMDKEFNPVSRTDVRIDITDPNGRSIQLPALPVVQQPGLYEAIFTPRASGPYLACATAGRFGQAQTGWTTQLEARELQSTKADLQLLEQIATTTKGRLIYASQLDQLAGILPTRSVPNTIIVTNPAWDNKWLHLALFLTLLGLILLEWTFRRLRGMP